MARGQLQRQTRPWRGKVLRHEHSCPATSTAVQVAKLVYRFWIPTPANPSGNKRTPSKVYAPHLTLDAKERRERLAQFRDIAAQLKVRDGLFAAGAGPGE